MKANVPLLLLTLTLTQVLAGCAAAPKPVPSPPPVIIVQPRPAPPPPPPPPADWRDAPRSPGTWRWQREGRLSVARYGAEFSLTCDAASRQVTNWRSASQPAAGPLTITTTSARRILNGMPDGGSIMATLTGSDAILDAMAFSRGRLMVETTGTAPLYLPSWSEISRVVEDCR